jgi:hypothetical protein
MSGSQNRAIVDKLITNVSSAFIPDGFISENILPFVPVKNYTGKLAKYGQQYLRLENSRKGGRGKYRQVEAITRSTDSYSIEGHGLEGMVTKEDYANVEAPYDAERDEAMGISTLLWIEKEKVLADTLASTAVLTSNTTLVGAQQYSDYNNSTPLEDFLTYRGAVRTACGKYPNAAWMDKAVADVLRFHPQLLDLLGYKFARPGGLSDDELARALAVAKVIVADVTYQPSVEGQTDASLTAVWGKHLWFGVIPDSPAPMQTSLGYRLGLTGGMPRKVTKWAINNPSGATAILVEDEYDFLLSNVGAAYLVKDAIA